MVSLSDIAKAAGVSVSTVSLALRGRGLVARKTAERVKALAKEMGYRPNPLLASIATKKFRAPSTSIETPVAIFKFPIVADQADLVSYVYDQPLRARLLELGYAPEVLQIAPECDARKIYREVFSQMVRGILLVGSLPGAFYRQFPWENFSVVHCGRFQNTQPFHTVRPDIFQSIHASFDRARECGYRRIGFAVGRHPVFIEDDIARIGAALGLQATYLPKKERLAVYDGAFNDREAFAAWMQEVRPDVVIGFSSWFYWELLQAGWRIPEDVGFLTLHHSPADTERKICGLDENKDEIARQSVHLLDQMIRNRETGVPDLPMNVLVGSSWRDGCTLRNVTRNGNPSARAPRRAR